MAKCIVCHERPAEVPDRNSMSPRKKLCSQCHGERLRGDLKRIVEFEAQLRSERKSIGE
jgi:cytochrome c553